MRARSSAPPDMLTTRLLPPEDWGVLRAIEPFASQGLPSDPEEWRVIVVERDGVLVGTCALFTAVHWDCWWIDPAQRGKGTVLSALLVAALQLLGEAGVQTAYTGAEHSATAIADLLEHFGFTPAPGRLFVLDVPAARQRLKEA